MRPKNLPKYIKLEGEVQQIMLQTELSEARRAILRVRIDSPLSGVAKPSFVKTRTDLRSRESDGGRLVETIQDLGIEPVPIHRDGLEVPLIKQRSDDMGHVVLRALKRQEKRRAIRLGEADLLGGQRPKEIAHAAGEPPDSQRRYFAARRRLGRTGEGEICILQRALRGQDKNSIARYTTLQKKLEPRHARGRFAVPCRAVQKNAAVDWCTDN